MDGLLDDGGESDELEEDDDDELELEEEEDDELEEEEEDEDEDEGYSLELLSLDVGMINAERVAAAVGGTALRQREALARLGVSGRRPDLALAHDDPARYLTLLSTAASDAEALAPDGWGGFWWVVTPAGERVA